MSLLGSLSQGAYQKSSQFVGDIGDKIKRAYVPETMSSMYGAGMFGELLKSIRDAAKTQKKDSDKTQKTIEKGYVDTRTLYLDMLKKLESIDKTLKSGQKQNATTQQTTGGDYSTGGQGNGASPMSPQKGNGDMLSSMLNFAKGNPITTLLGVGGLAALLTKAVAGITKVANGGGGNAGGGSSDTDYTGPGLRNNPITDLMTDAVTGYAGLKFAKGTVGTAIKGAWRQHTQKRAMLSALQEAQQAGMFGSPQSLGAPPPQLTPAPSTTSLGTNFEDAYARNRAAGMNPVDAKRAAGLEVRGTNFSQYVAKEAAMKPPIAMTPPTVGEQAASFGSKAAKFGAGVAKWGGTALGALGVGANAYDAYERNKKGDTVGTWLSGGAAALGAAGMVATATGFGAVAGIPLLAGSALLSGVGMARDWLRGPEADANADKKPGTAATADSGDTAKPIKRVLAAAPGELSVEYDDGTTATRKGPRSTRNNNPGNLEASSWTQTQPGFLGTDGRFAIFKTRKDGEAALQALLKGGAYNQMNLQQAISKYAPQSENNTRAYIQRLVSMGLDPNKRIADYTPKEMNTLTTGITSVEGGAGGIMNVALTGNKGGLDSSTGEGVSDSSIANAFGKNAGVLASSELAKLTGFLKEGLENIGNVNYNIDNSIRAAGGDPNAATRRTAAPNATRA